MLLRTLTCTGHGIPRRNIKQSRNSAITVVFRRKQYPQAEAQTLKRKRRPSSGSVGLQPYEKKTPQSGFHSAEGRSEGEAATTTYCLCFCRCTFASASTLPKDHPFPLAACKIRLTAITTRSTSSTEVCQLHTLTRIARRPCQVVPVKNASPEARISAIMRSVKASFSASEAPSRGSINRTIPD